MIYNCIFGLKIFLSLTNSVGPDEMLHCALFVNVPIYGFPVYKGFSSCFHSNPNVCMIENCIECS